MERPRGRPAKSKLRGINRLCPEAEARHSGSARFEYAVNWQQIIQPPEKIFPRTETATSAPLVESGHRFFAVQSSSTRGHVPELRGPTDRSAT